MEKQSTLHRVRSTHMHTQDSVSIQKRSGKQYSATGSMSCDRFLSFKPWKLVEWRWSAIMQPTARIIEAGKKRQNRGSDPYLWAFESMELDKSVFFTLSRLLPLPLSTTVLFNSSVILLRVRSSVDQLL